MSSNTNGPAISVALCTFNGEAYLSAQWQSLVQQELTPDEVIVCDDASSDGTVALVQKLTANAPFAVKLITNAKRLGFNKNFEKALSLCTGDLIFLCDQDDYWLPEKIQTIVNYMVAHPTCQMAFNNAWLADQALNRTDDLFWQQVKFGEKAQARWQRGEAMEVLLDGNRMMGSATVIRREFLSKLLPIPDNVPNYIYDGWLALVGAAYGVIDFVNGPLQIYRTHPTQQVGVRPPDPLRKYVTFRERFLRNRDNKLAPLVQRREELKTIFRLLSERAPANTPGMVQLQRRIDHFNVRATLPGNRLKRLGPVAYEMLQGNYQRYINPGANWRAPYLAAIGDILE